MLVSAVSHSEVEPVSATAAAEIPFCYPFLRTRLCEFPYYGHRRFPQKRNHAARFSVGTQGGWGTTSGVKVWTSGLEV